MLVVNAAASFPMQPGVGTGYDGVVQIGNCSATLLWTGRHILTAAHCVDTYNNAVGPPTLSQPSPPDGIVDPGNRTVTFTIPWTGDPVNGRTVSITVPAANIFIPKQTFDNNGDGLPDNNYDGDHSHGSDIAIMELPELAPFFAEGRQIYRGITELNHGIVEFLGFGGTNTTAPDGTVRNGGFGHDGSFGTKRIGYNVLDTATLTFAGSGGTDFDQNLRIDLDDPNGPTPGIAGEAIERKAIPADRC